MWALAKSLSGVFILLGYFSLAANAQSLEDRAALFKDLLRDYDAWNYPDNTTVQIGVSLLSIDAKEVENYIVTNVLLRQIWFDSRFEWDPKDYSGQNVISIPIHEIWRPEIKLLNSVSLPSIDSCADTKAIISNNGKILWVTPCQFESSCYLSLSNFNFGTRTSKNCSLKFGSWASDGTVTDLQFYNNKPELDLELFEDVTQWNVTGSNAKRVQKLICEYLFPYELIFQVFFENKSLFPLDTGAPAFGPGGAAGASGAGFVGQSGTASCGPNAKTDATGACRESQDF